MRFRGSLFNMDGQAGTFRMPYRQHRQYSNATTPSSAVNQDQLVGQPFPQAPYAQALPPAYHPVQFAQLSIANRCVGNYEFRGVECADRMSSFHQTRPFAVSQYPQITPAFFTQNIANIPTPLAETDFIPPPMPSPTKARRNTRTSARARAIAAAPTPDADYIQQAHNTPFATGKRQPLLVILDLNGTLLVRPQRKKRAAFVKRPYVDEFVTRCLAEHKVMVWSSAQPESVQHMVTGLVADEARRAGFVATWNRQQLRLSPAAYAERVQVYKHLSWVWDDEAIQASHPQADAGFFWDQTNTVLIDDSYLKASSEPYNHIEVPEFSEGLLAQEQTHPVLRELLRYLEEASHFEDVSTFIRSHPFRMPDNP